MREAKLVVGGVCDGHTQTGDVLGLVFHNVKPKCLRVDNHKAVAAIGGVDRDCAMTRYLKWNPNFVGKAGQVLHKDALRLAVFAFGADLHQAARGLQRHVGFRLLHRDDAPVQ
jgi:hypothetical protein